MTATTIMDQLARHAEQKPQQTALVCVDKKAHTRWSYLALYEQSVWLAGHLQAHVNAGDRALILMDTGIEYVTSFLACQYLGVTAIPSFPPESTKAQHIARTVGIAEDASATLVLTTSRFADTVSAMCESLSEVVVQVVDELTGDAPAAPRYPALSDDIAFLQYTSGSTAKPKGVMVSHGNLLANEVAIAERMQTSEKDVSVSWLPLFHDMGLIGGLLQPIYTGYLLVLCSPRYFMERPARWLQLISEYGGTISGGPDFSYRLCLERVREKQLEGLDLSSWRVAFSGAEPIRHDTLLDFAERFAPQGVKTSAIYPCYGLAEGTLMVTGTEAGGGAVIRAFDNQGLAEGQANQVEAKDLRDTDAYSHQVGCGKPASKHSVRITCPQSQRALADGDIGEIWAAGPSIALGYWQNEQATQETFVECEGKRWLRTGDVGYVFDGQLYISGRQKDLIIMNGHNVYPQDIERAIEAELSFVRKGRVSAFPVPSKESGEGIGLAIETSNSYRNDIPAEQTALIIRDFITEQFGACPELILLLDQGGLPKTSSGKLQRSACLKLRNAGELASYGDFNLTQLQTLNSVSSGADTSHWDALTQQLAQHWQSVLRYPVNHDDADFFALGGSSIKAAQLLALIQSELDCQLEPSSLFAAHRFADFCQLVREAKATPGIQLVASQLADYPLSTQQQRQLFLWQLEPQSSAYHIGATLELQGSIQPELLKQACAKVLESQPALRQAYFKNATDQWRQRTTEQPLQWQEHDISDAADPTAQAQTIQQQISQQPFALDKGENFRTALISHSEQQHRLVLVMHHIASDAWSFDLILAEVTRQYNALCANAPSAPTQNDALHYGDFALWQGEWLGSEQAAAQLAYWQQRLDGQGDEELFAPERARGADLTAPLGVMQFTLDHKHTDKLQQLAHGNNASLFMLLLSSLQVLFYRVSGKRQPQIGVAVANRNLAQLHNLVGFFINTQVIRGAVAPEQSFVQLLRACKTAALEAQRHQDYPFEKLVEVLNPHRSLGQTPLFQVMYNHLEQDVTDALALAGTTTTSAQSLQQQAQFDLSIDSRLDGQGQLTIELQYNQALYQTSTIARLCDAYQQLLNQLPQQAELAIGNWSLQAESMTMSDAAVGPQVVAQAGNWLSAISEYTKQNPDDTAVIFEDQHYSYTWLEQTANRLANGLVGKGLSGEVIGIMQARKPLMLASVLACLKANAAYLPLDPNFPQAKLTHMIDDSGCAAVLGDSTPFALSVPVISPVTLLSEYHEHSQSPEWSHHSHSLAYLNYTSGSTGQAKGVSIEHQALASYIGSAIDFINLTPDDVVLQFATINFDAFVEQVFPSWTVGATVVLRGDSLWDAETLYQQAQRHGISVMDLSAAYWRSIAASWARIAATTPLSLPRLRQVHSGGEAMSEQGISDWRQAGLGDVRLLNTYGPTEIVVEAAIYDCRALTPGESVPLGHALNGRRLYVLDHNLQPVANGQVGELYIGGEMLARGYWQRAAQTATRFIADPFTNDGGRMYASGDLVSWQAGALHYHGRSDHQVKIRGFRVELGEIETRLTQLPDVTAAVVITQQQAQALSLVAYVQSERHNDPEYAAKLKRALAEQLPEYMVPSHIVVLAQLPINASGKLERQQLPQVQASPSMVSNTASSDIELALETVWRKHLATEQLDLNANFFDLGGHSLLLMAVYDDLKPQFSQLQLTDLFAYPSIASLAAYLEQSGTVASQTSSTQSGAKQRRGMGAVAARKRKARES
ncbi:non-ribosomal peptide synthetase [Pseudoalteromonas rubra]|uniref:Non-ribosomal peptide synthetase n=1 Tax=Pseudoalteromonas rubra TaxID=43658 RepID=A0A5S3WRI9_9GAMM|nr:non-ribosomal peptide synthetase [Pseudoalteromonas rubra]TMP30024.1 non-ribosomal peptide synthetase [Pseudoalteromonas rubra]TMP30604.1 non-ribosomal peptide synthetase [Pseudoalteromonas rubra]